jgi:hypothetical protein
VGNPTITPGAPDTVNPLLREMEGREVRFIKIIESVETFVLFFFSFGENKQGVTRAGNKTGSGCFGVGSTFIVILVDSSLKLYKFTAPLKIL